ncbi:hypothetical protein GWK47_037760 [Chionoecetes opilio]|uniref:Uncharacterized protein n=1 Tax=Chionoecetes opilio TaxID=41210 RepID=A0A8J4YMU6_CHIOP|nr:hypothetical protein GWK47_037760 [Chionoecetes opilio]
MGGERGRHFTQLSKFFVTRSTPHQHCHPTPRCHRQKRLASLHGQDFYVAFYMGLTPTTLLTALHLVMAERNTSASKNRSSRQGQRQHKIPPRYTANKQPDNNPLLPPSIPLTQTNTIPPSQNGDLTLP